MRTRKRAYYPCPTSGRKSHGHSRNFRLDSVEVYAKPPSLMLTIGFPCREYTTFERIIRISLTFNLSSTNSTLCAQPCYCQTVETHSCVSANCQSFASGDFIQPSCLLRRKNASLHFDNNRLYEYPQFPQQEIRSIFMVSRKMRFVELTLT